MSVRVAIVHDYLTQRGGAERVVLRMLEAFPGARVVTSLYRPEATFPGFSDYEVETLPLNRWSPLRRDHRAALPFLARAFSAHEIDDVDVVLCSSSGWAHGVSTAVPKLVYCHNPPRWLYQQENYLRHQKAPVRLGYRLLRRRLLEADQSAARSATQYLANSTSVAARIRSAYGIEAGVLHPPYGFDVSGPIEPVPGVTPGFLLTVARRRGYKNVAHACEAAAAVGRDLVVVGGLPAREEPWPTGIVGLTNVPDAQLRWLYQNCSAVLAASHEDFGLTPVEGNAFGKPAIALMAGGFLDSITPGVNGTFFEELSTDSISEALKAFDPDDFDPEIVRAASERFSPQTFASQLHAHVLAAAGHQQETPGRPGSYGANTATRASS